MKRKFILSLFYYAYIGSNFASALRESSQGLLLFSIVGMYIGMVCVFPVYLPED